MRTHFLSVFLLVFVAASSQKLKKEDKQLIANLQKHVQILASDSLEGRRTGTPGEQKAIAYISNEFKTVGLQPKGTSGYYQPFEIDEGKQIATGTRLVVDGQSLSLNKHFIPFVFSPNISIEALASMAIQEVGVPWFVDLKELVEANAKNPHFDIYSTLKTQAKEKKEKR